MLRLDMSRARMPILALPVLVAVFAPGPSISAGEDAQGRLQGTGAAGITEVGRPLDMLRARAERTARERAVQSLVINALAAAGSKADAADVEKRVKDAAASKTSEWKVRYWTNGAVTATVSVNPADAPHAGDAQGHRKDTGG